MRGWFMAVASTGVGIARKLVAVKSASVGMTSAFGEVRCVCSAVKSSRVAVSSSSSPLSSSHRPVTSATSAVISAICPDLFPAGTLILVR